jgi:hypothetical protein
MGRGLQLVVLQVMMLLLMLLLLLLEMRLPGLARAHLLVSVIVPVGTNMRRVKGPLLVLMQLFVLVRARLPLPVLVDT